MGSTMDSVCNVLGIDRVNMSGKMIVIEEQHGSNANFVLNSVISNALKKNYGICLVLFHNTFGHYHNVGMKLGHNLTALKEKGQITVVEPMRTIASEVEHMCEDKLNTSNSTLTMSASNNNTSIIYNLFTVVKEKYLETVKSNDSVVLIVDDLSHLCDLGLSFRDSVFYVRYLRSLLEFGPPSQLCILTHTYQYDPQSCPPDTLVNGLKHMANLLVTVEPLKTGYSTDASGKMTINWKVDSVRREYHWPERAIYLYKLMDRQVKVYAPGTAAALP